MKHIMRLILCLPLLLTVFLLPGCSSTGETAESIAETEQTVETEIKKPDIKSYADVEATAKQIYFTGNTDRDATSYHTGDEIVFNFSLRADGKIISCPTFGWLAFTDDGQKYRGECSGETGTFELRIPATGTGFVRVKCFAKDEEGDLLKKVEQDTAINAPAIFGAGVNVEEIGVGMIAEPDDFDAFWADQLALLDACPPDILSVEELPCSLVGYKTVRIEIACPDGCGMAGAYLSYPEAAMPGTMPMDFSYHGYGTEDSYYNSTYPAETGKIRFSVSAHGLELGHPASFYSSLANYGFNTANENRDTCYFRMMLLRDLQMLRFAKAFFGTGTVRGADGETITGMGIWNGKITVGGGSQGGFQAIAMAGLDHDVTAANVSITWMCDIAEATAGKSMGSVFRPNYTDALAYFDTINFAKRVPATDAVTVHMGLGDYVSPPSSIFAMVNNMKCPVSMTIVQARTHGYQPPMAGIETRNVPAKP